MDLGWKTGFFKFSSLMNRTIYAMLYIVINIYYIAVTMEKRKSS